MSNTIPQPFVITVGMTKGGTHKTWISFNLGSYLGLMGYSVLVVDTNPQHDLAADYDWLMEEGIYPRFDVRVHDPIGLDGMPTTRLDLSSERGRDFIIYDTCQFLQLEAMRFIWANCHVMLAPVTPNCAEIRNYQNALRLYWALPGRRGPVIMLPTGVRDLPDLYSSESALVDAWRATSLHAKARVPFRSGLTATRKAQLLTRPLAAMLTLAHLRLDFV